MIEDLAPDTKIVLCSRTDVPINFARFAGPERTMRIGPADLRFDRVEIALLLSQIGANASVVARVDEFTQGWPMLVMMLFVLAKRGRLNAYLAGTGPDVTDLYGYLASEVLATLEPWAGDLLQVIIALPEARPSDLKGLYGEATSTRIADLQLATPFVIQSVDGTLAVHPAISEMLKKSPGRGIELAREIVDALSASEPIRAARIAAHLGEYDQAAGLLENARYFLSNPSLDLVDVLYVLPADSLIKYPAVWNVASYSRSLTRDSTEWLNEADRVLAQLTEATPIDVRVELFSGFMNIYYQRGEFAKAKAFSAEFAATDAGMHPMGLVSIRLWEYVAISFEGGYVDRATAYRELAPLMRVKLLELAFDYGSHARQARLAGDAVAERAILSRVVDEARASGVVLLHYLALTEALFGAWFWGDDDRFNALFREFQSIAHPSIERAMNLMIEACRARAFTAKTGTKQLKVRVYAYLIGAAKELNTGRRRKLLRDAVVAGDNLRNRLRRR